VHGEELLQRAGRRGLCCLLLHPGAGHAGEQGGGRAELQARGLLLGGGGLTDQQALSFFTSLQGLRRGRCYLRIMRDIERYKEERRMRIKMYSFFHNNKRIIAAVVSALGALGGITATLQSIRRTI